MAQVPIETVSKLRDLISNCAQRGAVKLVGIDGRGGSGKSTLASALANALPRSQIVHLDDFPYRAAERPFHPSGTQVLINWERVVAEALTPLAAGKEARYRKTPWWLSQVSVPEPLVKVPAGCLTIFEGVTCLRREYRDFFDLKIWIECPALEAANRGATRDGNKERDLPVWQQVYMPSEAAFFADHKCIEAADMVVLNGGPNQFALVEPI